ncbi:MAG: hypothetical protein H6744_13690 [Deltaproteobacteria bacterium]|nr:hypothetical protein [Deltaproteobacteria bacterium]
MRGWWVVLACAAAAAACGGDPAGVATDAATDDGDLHADADGADAADTTAPSCPAVVTQYVEIPGVAAPPNPVTGAATPAEMNVVRFIRYRGDTGDAPPAEADAILVVAPGFTVGSGYLTYMAQRLVARSCGRVEVWLTERRHHLLEDPTGMNAAEAAKDPRVAYGYYFEGAEVGGKTFGGVLDAKGPATEVLSEWGLDIALQDLRSVIHHVPEASRRASVFLGGHSRGVAYVEAYAATEFEPGHLGADELAGLVLIDGDSRYDAAMTEQDYLARLQRIREGSTARYLNVPPASPEIYIFLEIMALASSDDVATPGDPELGPDGRFGTLGPLESLAPLLFRGLDIQMTNEAFWGFAADTESAILDILRSGLGKLDGPTESDELGVYPSDEQHLYHWLHYDEVSPPEYCELQDLLHALYAGPSNAPDPYYAARLDQDFYVADHMDTAGTWRDSYFHLRSSAMSAPVYVLASRLLSGEPERVTDYRDRIAPVRGQSRPRSEFGFEIQWMPQWEHIDTVFAVENPFFEAVTAWMLETSTGTVQVDAFGAPWGW